MGIGQRVFRKIRRVLGDDDVPSMVCIETITTCNRKCSYCPNSLYDRGLVMNQPRMESALFRKIIDDLAQSGWRGEIVPHLYGEPLLDERLPAFFEYARTRLPGATLSLFSNGDYLTLDIYQDLIRRGVNRFHITRHSPHPTPAIRAILDYRKANGDAGVEFHYAQLDKIRNRGGLLTAIRGTRLAQCDTPFRTMFINVQGKVVFCCDDYLGTAILGDTQSEKVLEIWMKKRFRKLRQEVRRGIYELDVCRKCLEATWVESGQGG